MSVRRRLLSLTIALLGIFALSGLVATPASAWGRGLRLVHSSVATTAPTSLAPLPSPSDCLGFPKIPFGPCGNVLVNVTIAGFAHYGGLPPCPGTTTCYYDGYMYGRTVQAHWTLRCVANGLKVSGVQTLPLNEVYPGYPSQLNSFTRIDNNSANLQAGASFNFLGTATEASCPTSAANLTHLSLNHVVAHFQSSTFPSASFKIPGHYRVVRAGHLVTAPATTR